MRRSFQLGDGQDRAQSTYDRLGEVSQDVLCVLQFCSPQIIRVSRQISEHEATRFGSSAQLLVMSHPGRIQLSLPSATPIDIDPSPLSKPVAYPLGVLFP